MAQFVLSTLEPNGVVSLCRRCHLLPLPFPVPCRRPNKLASFSLRFGANYGTALFRCPSPGLHDIFLSFASILTVDPHLSFGSLLLYSFVPAMISRRILTTTNFLRARRPVQWHTPLAVHQVRSYADRIVKVPDMAESITEGTLKQWQKKVGDYVEQDEEIATIETDKVRLHEFLFYLQLDSSALRLTWPSTHLKPVPLQSFLPMRRIL
jgi:hypothetical protein